MINKKNSVLAIKQKHGKHTFHIQILAFLKLNFKYILGTILIFTIFTYFAEWLGRWLAYGL